MSFCSTLQRHLHSQFPQWTWRVAENANPSTSVIILSQGQTVPGEVLISLFDGAKVRRSECVVGGQAYCNFIKGGKTDADFAGHIGRKILSEAGLA